MRLSVEADVARSRGVRDSITFSVSDLEMQIEGLKADLVYMKSNHEEVRTTELQRNVKTQHVTKCLRSGQWCHLLVDAGDKKHMSIFPCCRR